LLNGPNEIRTHAVDGIGDHVLERKTVTFLDPLQDFDGKLRLCIESQFFRELTLHSLLFMALFEPFLWNEELRIEQCIPLGRGIRGKDANLAVFNFAQRSTILFGDSSGVFAFLGTSGFIEDQNSCGIPHIIAHDRVVFLEDRGLVPDYVTYESLHGAHLAALDLQGNWLNGLTLDLTELTDHVTVQILTWLAPGEAVVKLSQELS
jgi:hypothetical protein